MYSEFEDLNAYVYHSARSAFFDGLIWCLGPYVDDSRAYGWSRVVLAGSTRTIVRSWLRLVSPGALLRPAPARRMGGCPAPSSRSRSSSARSSSSRYSR